KCPHVLLDRNVPSQWHSGEKGAAIEPPFPHSARSRLRSTRLQQRLLPGMTRRRLGLATPRSDRLLLRTTPYGPIDLLIP
ncbi:MAG: hypothetical protein LC114_07625, partial [Bryobacterales bacterium]|nr:hypothetical protein [Bryobacterales bacterium]